MRMVDTFKPETREERSCSLPCARQREKLAVETDESPKWLTHDDTIVATVNCFEASI